MTWALEDGPLVSIDGERAWPIETLIDHGLLWAINTMIMHPRGYACFAVFNDEAGQDFVGLRIAAADNGAPVVYPNAAGPQHMGRLFAKMLPSPHPQGSA